MNRRVNFKHHVKKTDYRDDKDEDDSKDVMKMCHIGMVALFVLVLINFFAQNL